jgi:hypothetical protein
MTVAFHFNFSTDGGSNYNVTKTTTFFDSYHREADTATTLYIRIQVRFSTINSISKFIC